MSTVLLVNWFVNILIGTNCEGDLHLKLIMRGFRIIKRKDESSPYSSVGRELVRCERLAIPASRSWDVGWRYGVWRVLKI